MDKLKLLAGAALVILLVIFVGRCGNAEAQGFESKEGDRAYMVVDGRVVKSRYPYVYKTALEVVDLKGHTSILLCWSNKADDLGNMITSYEACMEVPIDERKMKSQCLFALDPATGGTGVICREGDQI